LPAHQNAVAILAGEGCRCANLAFKAGSPPNYYALALLFARFHVRPGMVILEINQPSFSPADQAYKTLTPSLAAVVAPLLSPADRAALVLPSARNGIGPDLDEALASLWLVYGARADLRALLLGDADAEPARQPTADDFLGTYDLAPLDQANVGVRYLEKTVDLLHDQSIPVVAFMSPTNHTLVHEYIDVPAYRANEEYLDGLLEKRGVKVIDLDRAFSAENFIDNVHLTREGQRRLAVLLAKDIPQLSPMK